MGGKGFPRTLTGASWEGGGRERRVNFRTTLIRVKKKGLRNNTRNQ